MPTALSPSLIHPSDPDFATVCSWPYADAFVLRILQGDIPRRISHSNCTLWVYRDAAGAIVGFGTLDVSGEYSVPYASGQLHPYLPLLAVKPSEVGKGYGRAIVQHLADEAVVAARAMFCFDVLFLDVYDTSTTAIHLYKKCGFQIISPLTLDPGDPQGKSYYVMAKRVSVVGLPPPQCAPAP